MKFARIPIVDSGTDRADRRQELMRRIIGFSHHHHDRLAARVAALGLTPAQAKALYFIEPTISMRKLASKMHCDASNVTGIVDRLEELQFLERRVDDSDRRIKRLVVTPKGRRVRNDVAHAMFDVPELAKLTDDEEAALAALFIRVWDELGPLD
jgi:DNA-binding MarR family transcriptional regulator